jgi:hypothetical protein
VEDHLDEMAMQTASSRGKIYVWTEPDEVYLEEYVEPTFIPGFKWVKTLGAVRYGKRASWLLFQKTSKKERNWMWKLDVETYMAEIMDELFDFWQESMEDCGHVVVMEDGAPPRQGIASQEGGNWKRWVGRVGDQDLGHPVSHT